MFKLETYRIGAITEELFNSSECEADEMASHKDRILKALEDLEKRLLERYLNSPKDQPLERYLRLHQRYLTELSDRLFASIDSQVAGSDERSATIRKLFEMIEGVLLTCKNCFGDMFDRSAKVTRYYQRSFADRTVVSSGSIPSENEMKTLLNAVSVSLHNLCGAGSNERPSYLTLAFAEKIISRIDHWIIEPGIDAACLFDHLYQEDFNAPAVAAWYQKDVLKQLKHLEESERSHYLNAQASRLLVNGLRSKDRFAVEFYSLTDELPKWLDKIKTKYITDGDGRCRKMAMKFSVTQFGLFLRLCQKTGCFQEQNVSEILRFFARNFTSKKQVNISGKSLAKAFYNADQTTAATCRAWLQRMTEQINKQYFPK